VTAVVHLLIALSAAVSTGLIWQSTTIAVGSKVARPGIPPIAKSAALCPLGINLIVNGDAEADPTATGDGFENLDVSAWENETGEFTLARYNAPSGFPTSTDPGPANRGTFMFVAGFAEISSGSQVIDLSDCSSQIDGGALQFDLGGFLGGFVAQNDSPSVFLTFKNGAQATLGTATIGPVTGVERNNVTGLIERKSVGAVPVGTRSVEVVLQTTRRQGVYNDGYADNISLVLNTTAQSCTALPAGALSWWKAEGNGGDVLGVNNGLLRNGTTFSTGLVGQAFTFDGVDDNVLINRPIQDDFTIEFWLNTTQIVGTDGGQWWAGRGLVDGEVISVTNDFGVTLLNGKVLFGVGNPDVTIRSGIVADGNWHHVAATRLRSTGEIKLYIDGLQVASATGGTQSLTAPPRLMLGRLQIDGNPFQGKLDEVAIYGRVLSPAEITAIYGAGAAGKCTIPPACAPALPNMVAWWRAEGNANDALGAHSGTLQGGATFAPGKVGQAFDLTGDDDYVDLGNWFTLPEYSIAMWVNPGVTQLPFADIIDNNHQTGINWVLQQDGPNPNSYVFGDNAAVAFNLTANTWQFFTATRTNNTLRVYLNGVLQGEQSGLSPVTYNGQQFFRIGRFGDPAFNRNWNGLVDELDVYNRALAEAEIQSLYNAGSAGKCAPGAIQSLTFSPNPVNGGQNSTGTLTLTTAAPTGGMLVNLASSDTGVAMVPPSVTVAAGQTTATFTITISVPASDAAALITASGQTGSTSATLTVLSPKPDLTVTAAAVPTSTLTDAAFNISWTVKNQGAASAGASWADRVWLSNDNQFGADDRLVGEFPFNSNLEPGQSAERIQTVSIARNAVSQDGAYFLLIQTDANNQIPEGANENNNALARPISVTRQPRPDLVVDNIAAPNSAFFGQTILVQWTVKNIGGGPTNAQGWQDFVYLSLDNVPEIEDPFKLPLANVSYLAAGESYTATAEVKIPQGLVGQYKLIVWTDGDGTNHRSNSFPHQVVEDDDENNYSLARPIQLNTPTLPDLQTVSVVAPEEVFAGGQMTLNWRIENRGDGVTPPDQVSWTDRIYLSRDTTLDVNADRLVGSRPRSGALTQNEGYTVSNFSTTLPNDLAGDWYVFVLADGDNRVYEFNHENNNAGYDTQQPGSPVHVRATPPDLVIPNLPTAPANGSSGQSISVGWTVKNQGAFEAAPKWFDAIYLSSDQTLNTETDTLLTSVFRNAPLGPGLTYDVSANVTLPPCISGSYYVFVLTDSRRQIFEFDPNFNAEANNASQPRPIQIVDAMPDLRVNAVSHPAAGSAGQAISVSWTVANQGAGATVATKWTDRIYLTPTQTFDSATALLVGSFDCIGALGNGTSYTRTESITLPNSAQGSYFVSVLTDAINEVEECANEANNRGFGSQAITVNNSLPDLAVQSAGSEVSPVGGQTVDVSWTAINQGVVNADNASWGDAVYFSADAVFGEGDVRLATASAAGPLASGATYNRQTQVTLPVVPPGNYFLLIRADYLGNVFEGQREDNNLSSVALTIQAPPVDLSVTTVNAPSSAFSGQDMTVSWTVTNGGSGPTVGSHWIDEVVLSLDQIDDPSDRVVGSKRHEGVLNGQASYSDLLSVFVPQGFTGQYYVFVRTDRRNEIAESNEHNNSAADGLVFDLTPPADLLVSGVTPSSGGSPGEPFTVSWTIQNGGPNAATGLWSDAVYLSSDQTWDIGDIPVVRQTRVGPLTPGQSYNGQLTTTLPALNPGGYYLIVKTDAQNRVRETDEGNNAGTATAQTPVDVVALQIGVPRSTTLTTGQERFFKTDAPANETVRFALEGQAGSANELFARFGQIASRNSFDFSFSRSNEANQEVLVPNSQAGSYFTLARSEFSTPSPQSVTVRADVIPFGITSVSPNRVGDNGQVTITLKGARFEEGATVQLSGNGTTLNAAKVIRVNSSTVKARFIFANAPRGLYNVTLINPSGQTSTLNGAVTIERAVQAQPIITSTGGLRTRPLRPLGYYNEVINRGNVDIQYVSISTQVFRPHSTAQVVIINNRPNESLPRKAAFPEVDWNNAPLTNASSGHLTTDNFLYRDLAPGEVFSYNTEIRGLNVDDSFVRNQAVGLSRDELIGALRESVEFLRQQLIEKGINSPNVETAGAMWDLMSGLYQAYEVFEGVVDDNPSALLDGVKSIFSNLWKSFGPEALAEGCKLVVNNTNLGCGLKCGAKFGCANIVTATSALAAVAYMEVGNAAGVAFNAAGAGLNAWDSIKEGFNCANNCPQLPPPDCQFAESSTSDEFAKPCVDFPIDPNEKLGPDGYGEQRFVSAGEEIPYTINFENLLAATAYAQRVRITDRLDPSLDPRTVRLREIGFKQYRFQVPENRAFFQQRVQLGPDLGNLMADISAGVDLATGTVTWTLTAIDPATGEQPNGAGLGLLPPNNESNDGQGFITFTVRPKSTAATGSVISNGATITFDTEAPINTNVVSNTLDAEAPASAVASLPPTQPGTTFNLSWSGSDAPNGSGLMNYDVFVSANGGPYQPLVSGTAATGTQFTGEPNTTYRFYSVARDNAGNVESAPTSPDAVTAVGNPPPAPPTANAATGVTASGFTSNWSGSDGATGYRLDVSLDSSFGSYVSGYQDLDVGNVLSRGVTGLSASTTYHYRVRAYNAEGVSGHSNTVSVATASCAPRIDNVSPKAGRAAGGQQITLTGNFACVSAVTVGGASVSWNYGGDAGTITFLSPPHSVGTVDIAITTAAGAVITKSNAFAYLPTVFTDNTLAAGVTTAKAQHVIELRQAVDALRAVAGLQPALWTDATLAPTSAVIKAVHIRELRGFLDDAATRLGYPTSPYTDPTLTTSFVIRLVYIEELRQRIRAIAG
jgi:subtilase family serine protease